MKFFNGGHLCAICEVVHRTEAAAEACFAGHGFGKIGEYLHFRLCRCCYKNTCALHSDGNGNPEGWEMYWHREATMCAIIATQQKVSLHRAVFLYINAKNLTTLRS